jgi:hypothetical protein
MIEKRIDDVVEEGEAERQRKKREEARRTVETMDAYFTGLTYYVRNICVEI